MAKITRFFNNIYVTPSGLEIQNIISNNKNLHTGFIDQVIVSRTSGSATAAEIQIRYEPGYSGREKLVYLYTEAELPLFVDSHINGPFSLFNVDVEGGLHLYVEPDGNCILNIRIDMEINNLSGL